MQHLLRDFLDGGSALAMRQYLKFIPGWSLSIAAT
jgi:hypothetical protein